MNLEKAEVPSLDIPPIKKWPSEIKKMVRKWRRVYKITKKPGKEEYTSTVKVTGLGTIIIGAIGFAIFLIVELIK